MTSAGIVDAHHHVWDLAVRDQPWISGAEMAPIRRSFCLDDLRPSARAAGVRATVLVQADRRAFPSRADSGLLLHRRTRLPDSRKPDRWKHEGRSPRA